MCKWLVSIGAKCLVLVGRRPANQETAALLQGLRDTHVGLTIEVRQADVSSRSEVKNCQIFTFVLSGVQLLRFVCNGVLKANVLGLHITAYMPCPYI